MSQNIDNTYPAPAAGLPSPGISPGKRTAPVVAGSPFPENPDVASIAVPSDANKSGVLPSHRAELASVLSAVGRSLPSPGPVRADAGQGIARNPNSV